MLRLRRKLDVTRDITRTVLETVPTLSKMKCAPAGAQHGRVVVPSEALRHGVPSRSQNLHASAVIGGIPTIFRLMPKIPPPGPLAVLAAAGAAVIILWPHIFPNQKPGIPAPGDRCWKAVDDGVEPGHCGGSVFACLDNWDAGHPHLWDLSKPCPGVQAYYVGYFPGGISERPQEPYIVPPAWVPPTIVPPPFDVNDVITHQWVKDETPDRRRKDRVSGAVGPGATKPEVRIRVPAFVAPIYGNDWRKAVIASGNVVSSEPVGTRQRDVRSHRGPFIPSVPGSVLQPFAPVRSGGSSKAKSYVGWNNEVKIASPIAQQLAHAYDIMEMLEFFDRLQQILRDPSTPIDEKIRQASELMLRQGFEDFVVSVLRNPDTGVLVFVLGHSNWR